MPRVCTALALAALIPITAQAEPINVNLYSSSAGFQEGPTGVSTGWFSLNLGEIKLDEGATATYFVSGLKHGSDYTVEFDLAGTASFDNLRLEVLDPLGDGDDKLDDSEGRATPSESEYSISNNLDGISFAQGSGLDRSAVFAGGSAGVTADEITHRGDILLFSGLSGAEDARVTFGLRDHVGGRGFLLQITALGDMTTAPEPGSMLLLGTGLAGLAAARRRRRARNAA